MSISDTSAPDTTRTLPDWETVGRQAYRDGVRAEPIHHPGVVAAINALPRDEQRRDRERAILLSSSAGWQAAQAAGDSRADTAAAPRTLTIRHTYADGTLLAGVTRPDDLYRTLRGLGWLYRRSCDDYRLQASQDKPAKTGAIEQTVQVLQGRGFAVTVTIDTESRPVAAAETERGERAQIRAGRLHGRADRLDVESATAETAARRVLDNIPLGQPYIVDSSGYGADRRRREGAFAQMHRSVELGREAATTRAAGDTAERHMDHRYAPDTVVNRLRGFEANLRAAQRRRTDAEAADPSTREAVLARIDEEIGHLREQITYWAEVREQQIRDGGAPNYGREDLETDDLVLYNSSWYPVVRVNRVSVTVPSPMSNWTDTVRFEFIRARVRRGEDRWAARAAEALAFSTAMAGTAPMHAAWTALAE
jgi:hypothetical protein